MSCDTPKNYHLDKSHGGSRTKKNSVGVNSGNVKCSSAFELVSDALWQLKLRRHASSEGTSRPLKEK